MGWKRNVMKSVARFPAPGWRAASLAGFLDFALRCTRPREREALANLALAYPESSEDFREGVLRDVYSHLAWMTAEYLALQADPAQSLSWILRTDGEEHLVKAAEAGKGAIILTGHLGNWELLAAWLCQRGYPLTAIVRDPDDPDYRTTIDEFRAHVGLKTLPKNANMKAAVDLLRKGGFLGILSDQLGDRHGGLEVPFMGRTATTFAGAASLGILADCPIVPVFSYREAPFNHRVEIYSPIPFPETGNRGERILELTYRCNQAIEKAIRKEPGQWLWLHRRWGKNIPLSQS